MLLLLWSGDLVRGTDDKHSAPPHRDRQWTGNGNGPPWLARQIQNQLENNRKKAPPNQPKRAPNANLDNDLDGDPADPFPTVGAAAQYDLGGYLIGAAAVIDAQGRYFVNAQQANLMREQVRQAQLENRQREFDWWLYRRQNTPSRQDDLEREAREDLRYTRFAPAKTDVWSGRALNVVLENLKRADLARLPGIQQPIETQVLQRINLTDGRQAGNLGLLKNDGKLTWPVALRSATLGAEGEELRRQIQTLLARVYGEVRDQRDPDTGAVREIGDCIRRLEVVLRGRVDQLGFNEYVTAKTYLRQLSDSLTVLQKGNAADYVNGKYALKNLKDNTVGAVVRYLRDNGLEFAPACDGDYEAYVALHRALANADPASGILATEERKAAPEEP